MAWMILQLWGHILYIDHIVYILNIHIYVYTSMENIMKYRHLCFLLKKCLFWMRKQKIYIYISCIFSNCKVSDNCYIQFSNIYVLFAGWEVRVVKNCDRRQEWKSDCDEK